MWQSLHDAWWRLATESQPRSLSDALACSVLRLGSVAYRAAVGCRNAAYDRGWATQVRLPCRVVSVGNLTVGGTGKTTCVELVANKLLMRGHRIAILSRGYGGARRDYWLRWEAGQLVVGEIDLSSDEEPSTQPLASLRTSPIDLTMGRRGLADEPQLLARRLAGIPIIVGARRDRTGQVACTTFGADTVVLDDGFQHRRLQRDCDIVVVHVRMPFSGWAVLPRGPMREPLTALARAHIIVITKADEAMERLGALEERLRSLNPEATLVTSVHEPATLQDGMTGQTEDPKRLAGLRIGLLSSIGDPEGFDATVRRLHATVNWHLAFPDHHWYQRAEWARVCEKVRGDPAEALVTTEKDWVRLKPIVGDERLPVPLWVLGVRMKVLNGEEALDGRLARLHGR